MALFVETKIVTPHKFCDIHMVYTYGIYHFMVTIRTVFTRNFSGNLERECEEEVCSWDEAMEIFEDKAATDTFMDNKLHMCENTSPCYPEGSTGRCENKWGNYW